MIKSLEITYSGPVEYCQLLCGRNRDHLLLADDDGDWWHLIMRMMMTRMMTTTMMMTCMMMMARRMMMATSLLPSPSAITAFLTPAQVQATPPRLRFELSFCHYWHQHYCPHDCCQIIIKLLINWPEISYYHIVSPVWNQGSIDAVCPQYIVSLCHYLVFYRHHPIGCE